MKVLLIVIMLFPVSSYAAMTATQQADALFKASLGVANSDPASAFYSQPQRSAPVILPSQVWQQADQIPLTAPGGADQQVTGVVKRWIALSLTAVSGSTTAFTHAALADAIPFNAGDGTSYNYAITGSTGVAVPFGTNDWVLQNGVLTFYGGVSGISTPPKISFYQYVGTKGVGSGTASSDIDGGTW